MTEENENSADVWSRWLLQTRFADADHQQFVCREVERFRDRVLDAARLAPGMTLLDVGAGDGLIAFGAIARVGPSLRVILADISAPLLACARNKAAELGIQDQCRFVHAGAEKLTGLPDASVDVVATRSALAYVADKARALQEFHRVLKPRGRISLCEPINQDDAFEVCALGRLIAAQPDHQEGAYLRLLHRWKAAQYPSTEELVWRNPITNFNERDLARFARQAGFVNVHVELHMDYRPAHPLESHSANAWERALALSPHPWAPSLGQILAEQFTPEERQLFERVMRPRMESQMAVTTEIVAYLVAETPE